MSCAAFFGWDTDLHDELDTEEYKEQARLRYQESRAHYLSKVDDWKEAIKESNTALKDPNLSKQDRQALNRKIKYHKQMMRMNKKSLRSVEWEEDVRTKRNHSLWFKFKYELYVWWMLYVFACSRRVYRNHSVYPVHLDQSDPADLAAPVDQVGQVDTAVADHPESSQEC